MLTITSYSPSLYFNLKRSPLCVRREGFCRLVPVDSRFNPFLFSSSLSILYILLFTFSIEFFSFGIYMVLLVFLALSLSLSLFGLN